MPAMAEWIGRRMAYVCYKYVDRGQIEDGLVRRADIGIGSLSEMALSMT
jgi:hypothetical protein